MLRIFAPVIAWNTMVERGGKEIPKSVLELPWYCKMCRKQFRDEEKVIGVKCECECQRMEEEEEIRKGVETMSLAETEISKAKAKDSSLRVIVGEGGEIKFHFGFPLHSQSQGVTIGRYEFPDHSKMNIEKLFDDLVAEQNARMGKLA